MSFVIPRAGGRLLELLLTTLSSGHKRFRVHIRFEPVECKYIYLISNSLQFHACAAIRKCPHGSHTHTHTHLDVYQAAHTHTHTHSRTYRTLYRPKIEILLVLLESRLSHVLRCYTFHMAHAMRVCVRVFTACVWCVCEWGSHQHTRTLAHSHIHHAHYKRASGAGIF